MVCRLSLVPHPPLQQTNDTWCAGPATKRGPLGWHAGFLSCRNLLNSKRMTRGVRCAGPATELGLHLLPFSSPHLAFCIFSSVHPSDVHAGLLSQVSSCATNASSAYPSLHPGIHASRVVRVSRALSTPKCIGRGNLSCFDSCCSYYRAEGGEHACRYLSQTLTQIMGTGCRDGHRVT